VAGESRPVSPGAKIGFAAVPAALILALAALLAQPDHENRIYKTYWDALGGVWTVCAGVTGEGVIPGKTYTDDECVALETRYIARMYARMGRCVPNARMAFHEVKAWGHFAYNVGEANFCKSTAARLLNQGRNAEACRQIGRWRFIKGKDCAIRANKCYGIVKRRAWEESTCEGRA
jgi:GH24 family phage-related lysozyme (muramidase)